LAGPFYVWDLDAYVWRVHRRRLARGSITLARSRLRLVKSKIGTPATHLGRRLAPVYSVEEAAGYLRIPINTLRSWTIGRRKLKGHEYYEPVLQFVDKRLSRLSFYDLVEAHILRAAVDQDVPLQQLRRGLAYLRKQHPNSPRPLLTYNFLTDGKYLLVGGMLGPKDKDRDVLLNASVHGQLEMTEMLSAHLQLIRGFDEYFDLVGRDRYKMPDTLFPKDGQKIISITSGVYSGRPVIEGTRIPTSIVAQRFLAGEDPAALAKDYRISKERIEAAIKYEQAA
jgi:uncharacterized protein (DUF433 family)